MTGERRPAACNDSYTISIDAHGTHQVGVPAARQTNETSRPTLAENSTSRLAGLNIRFFTIPLILRHPARHRQLPDVRRGARKLTRAAPDRNLTIVTRFRVRDMTLQPGHHKLPAADKRSLDDAL